MIDIRVNIIMEHITKHNIEQPIFKLPYELHIKIFESLHIRHIRKLSLTCSKFKDLMKDKYLIRKILIQMKEPLEYIDNPLLVLYDINALNKFRNNMTDILRASMLSNLFGIIDDNNCATCLNKLFRCGDGRMIDYIKNKKHLKICKEKDFGKHKIKFSNELVDDVFMENIKRYLKMIQFKPKVRNHSKESLFLFDTNIDDTDYTDFVFTIYSYYHKKYIHILFDAHHGGFLYLIRCGDIDSKQYYILSDSPSIPSFDEFKTKSTAILFDTPFDYTGNTNIQGHDFHLSCAYDEEEEDQCDAIYCPEDYDENGNLIQDIDCWEDYD